MPKLAVHEQSKNTNSLAEYNHPVSVLHELAFKELELDKLNLIKEEVLCIFVLR